jgi:hypothetical protein
MSEFWPAERDQELVRLHEKGVSFREMAALLGVTRNACIGKAARMGLGKRATRPKTSHFVQPSKHKMADCGKMGAMIMRMNKKLRGNSSRDARREAPCPPQESLPPQLPPPEHYVSFAEVTGCRWPHGEGEHKRFCNAERKPESSYCPQHHAIAWFPTSRQKNRKPFILKPILPFDKFMGGSQVGCDLPPIRISAKSR